MLKKTIKKWNNQDNIDFYNKMSIIDFISYAKASGLTRGEDVKQLKDFILSSSSILEVGCGYGRVLKHILELGYKKKLEAIDTNKKYYDFCKDRYGHKVKFYNKNIINFEPLYKYNLILWMWSGIFEYSKDEQKYLFGKLSNLLSETGILAVERINYHDSKCNLNIDGNNWLLKGVHNTNEYIYIPTENDIRSYAESNLKIVNKINYFAGEGVLRTIYLFSLF
jgi:SAM-dependent methyltransferase